jgi:lysozyme family protein
MSLVSGSGAFDLRLPVVLLHEGGFVQHPQDPGGATKFGITRETLARFRGTPVTVEDVRSLTTAEAAAIYRRLYWDPIRGDELPAGVDLAVFDFTVNSGPSRAVRTLQGALGVPQDGIIGPVTLAAAQVADPVALIRHLSRDRLRFLSRLAIWPVFGRGWRRRVLAVEQEAIRLAHSNPETQEGLT